VVRSKQTTGLVQNAASAQVCSNWASMHDESFGGSACFSGGEWCDLLPVCPVVSSALFRGNHMSRMAAIDDPAGEKDCKYPHQNAVERSRHTNVRICRSHRPSKSAPRRCLVNEVLYGRMFPCLNTASGQTSIWGAHRATLLAPSDRIHKVGPQYRDEPAAGIGEMTYTSEYEPLSPCSLVVSSVSMIVNILCATDHGGNLKIRKFEPRDYAEEALKSKTP
jgi:hypothetical protein